MAINHHHIFGDEEALPDDEDDFPEGWSLMAASNSLLESIVNDSSDARMRRLAHNILEVRNLPIPEDKYYRPRQPR